jgi:hypothetical protein
MEVALIGMLLPPTVDFDLNLARQLAAQILHVNPGTAVDVRRVFPCEESNSQCYLPRADTT